VKATLKASELRDAVALSTKIVPSRNVVPILDNLLLRADGDRFSVTAHNLEQSLIAFVSGEIVEPGRATVNARQLDQMLRAIADDASLKIETDGDILKISTGRSRYRLKTLPAGDFPPPLVADEPQAETAP